MKKILLSIFTVLILCTSAEVRGASKNDKTISVKGLELVQENDEVKITFVADIGRKATKSDYTLAVVPTLSKGREKAEFPAIIIKGKRAEIANDRRLMALSGDSRDPRLSFVHNGDRIDYSASIPYEEWMDGAELTMEGVSEGCCNAVKTRLGVIAADLAFVSAEPAEPEPVIYIPVETPVAVVEPEPVKPAVPGFHYSFVAPLAEYEEAARRSATDLFGNPIPLSQGRAVYQAQQDELDQFIDFNRQGSLSIYFRQGKKDLEPSFRGNYASLDLLLRAIKDVESSPHHRIEKIVIAGFASPEGSTKINHYLGWERGKTIKEFVLRNSRTISPQMIDIYNGQVDWRGLREIVAESNMADKYEVLDIIDNVPVWDSNTKQGRLGTLMRLRGGATYNYMYNNIFPDLRNGTCIRIYYEELD